MAQPISYATDYASNRGLIAACRQEFATHVFEPRLGQEEYVRFLSPNSPYISTLGGFDLERSLLSVDAEKKTCVFIQRFHDRLQVTTRGPALSDLHRLYKPGPYNTLTLTFVYRAYSSPRWRTTTCSSFQAWSS